MRRQDRRGIRETQVSGMEDQQPAQPGVRRRRLVRQSGQRPGLPAGGMILDGRSAIRGSDRRAPAAGSRYCSDSR